MILRDGQVYRCQNADCRAEIHVVKPSIEGSSNPRCCCGAEMKKPYSAPTMTELTETFELLQRFCEEPRPRAKAAPNNRDAR